MVDKPTGEQLCAGWMEDEETIVEVSEECEPDDHGYAWTRVFQRLTDDTFWMVSGVNQSGGDYDTLRDDYKTIDVTRVWPVTVSTTSYTATRPHKD